MSLYVPNYQKCFRSRLGSMLRVAQQCDAWYCLCDAMFNNVAAEPQPAVEQL